ncbi:SubName: Full=Uncharacterized protein {ECO:0000313/EMBL:CCA75860.1} [Serendipita indica DSM 11827]|nr:SubName: Full=Uncharacterized protein {ECO:0000313/EMBL:CCA75860.1} [Serendipita indica DSM 11827]
MSHMVHPSQPRAHSSRPTTPRSIILNHRQREGEGEYAPSYAYASSSASTSSPQSSASSACASSPRSAVLSLLLDGEDTEYLHSYGLTTPPTPPRLTLPSEEELDVLPSYTPSVQLLSLCRRKRVYTSTDVKARDRRWQLVWLLLDGTALRVYEPTAEEARDFERRWREKYLPKDGKPPTNAEVDELEDVDAYEARSRSSGNASCPRRTTQPSTTRTRSNSTAKTDSSNQTRLAIPSSLSPPTSSNPHPSIPIILSRKPTKSYPIRHIKCTRPTNYFRRAFLIQLTFENGKTFLVQLNSHQETLDWLNAVAVAAPLALDLDERVMVEANPFPRQRREQQIQVEAVLA